MFYYYMYNRFARFHTVTHINNIRVENFWHLTKHCGFPLSGLRPQGRGQTMCHFKLELQHISAVANIYLKYFRFATIMICQQY